MLLFEKNQRHYDKMKIVDCKEENVNQFVWM